ncbi:MAG: GNAT family N-acetyltransferase [Clostridia bacterium]|nr:GNAT family N-acetyltransferase [Clostridia bacterium]
MLIRKLERQDVKTAAPLMAGFRVKLRSFKGEITEPDTDSGEAELNEYLDNGFPAFIAAVGDTPVGLMVCRLDEPCVWVEALYVAPEYRRQGIASLLFDKAEEIAASFGESTVYNYIHPNNEAVKAFLASRGYTVLNLLEVRKPYPGEKLTRKIRVDESEFDY